MKEGILKEHESDVELSLFCLHQKAVLTLDQVTSRM